MSSPEPSPGGRGGGVEGEKREYFLSTMAAGWRREKSNLEFLEVMLGCSGHELRSTRRVIYHRNERLKTVFGQKKPCTT